MRWNARARRWICKCDTDRKKSISGFSVSTKGNKSPHRAGEGSSRKRILISLTRFIYGLRIWDSRLCSPDLDSGTTIVSISFNHDSLPELAAASTRAFKPTKEARDITPSSLWRKLKQTCIKGIRSKGVESGPSQRDFHVSPSFKELSAGIAVSKQISSTRLLSTDKSITNKEVIFFKRGTFSAILSTKDAMSSLIDSVFIPSLDR
mmetsp:Transcript_5135/g.8074  ORF Transcript_5135/g.8074 Transcript_5135/m.8074 type:complete len:206 (+) Transcript_5135:325-942(+)